jgi:hypothetical protein
LTENIRTHLHDVPLTGAPAERSRAIEALLHETRFEDGHFIPVFKIPDLHISALGIPASAQTPKTRRRPQK